MILYKYFAETRLDVLRTFTLRFTQPIHFNDPFEVLPLQRESELETKFELSWEEGLRSTYGELVRAGYSLPMGEAYRSEHLDALSSAVELVKSDPLLATLCYTGSSYQLLWSIGLGILCLTARPDNLLMWSHYASECKGFVVGFDTTHEWFLNQRHNGRHYPLTPVSYTRRRPRRVTSMFFRKATEWRYEEEWRMLSPIHQCTRIGDGRVFVKRFPPEAIDCVLMGCRMGESSRVELLRAVRDLPAAKLYKTFPGVHQYRMELVPYERAFHIPFFGSCNSGTGKYSTPAT